MELNESLKLDFAKGIYFYCTLPTIPGNTYYPHIRVCLAEGFRELGIPVYSNVTNWQLSVESQDHLFIHDPDVTPKDCSVVVLDTGWIDIQKSELPDDLFQPGREYITVYIDDADGAVTSSWNPAFRQFDVVLRTHMLEGYKYPKNFYPWFFGISNRMIAYLEERVESHQRKRNFLVNFRHTKHMHSVRKWMSHSFSDKLSVVLKIDEQLDNFELNQVSSTGESVDCLSNDALYWKQTARRHNPHYYASLKESLAVACFGGFFVKLFENNHATRLSRASKRLLSKWPIPTSTIVQWDNWRFWESLLAGCVAFHADFDQYHFALPVKPENWKHYIGVNCKKPNKTIERILDEPDLLYKIGNNGREWAINHYTPVPTSIRFLELMSQIGSSSPLLNIRGHQMQSFANTDRQSVK